jgi:ubiquinone/menaquinone biosynthesis C-methylase UbiE
MSATGRLQLHLGCGKRYIPGFVHVDVDDFPHIDYRASIDRLPMFESDTVDLIYCCHAFTYFDRLQASEVLAEWRRVLKPAGILRLAVPDFEALARLYETTGDLTLILGPLFGRITVETVQGPQVLYERTTYDFRSMERICLQAGFKAVARYDWRQTIHKEYDDHSQAYFPHMDKEHGVLLSLNVEAVK